MTLTNVFHACLESHPPVYKHSVADSSLRLILSSNVLMVHTTRLLRAASDSLLPLCDSRQHGNFGHCEKVGVKQTREPFSWFFVGLVVCLFKKNMHWIH